MTNDTAHDPGIHLPWAGKAVRMSEIEAVHCLAMENVC